MRMNLSSLWTDVQVAPLLSYWCHWCFFFFLSLSMTHSLRSLDSFFRLESFPEKASLSELTCTCTLPPALIIRCNFTRVPFTPPSSVHSRSSLLVLPFFFFHFRFSSSALRLCPSLIRRLFSCRTRVNFFFVHLYRCVSAFSCCIYN